MRSRSPTTVLVALVAVAVTVVSCSAFVTPSTKTTTRTTTQSLLMPPTPQPSSSRRSSSLKNMVLDPLSAMDGLNAAASATTTTSSSDLLLAFTDQGQNLAGIFFQSSLLPYLLFLYFLSFRGNRISDLGNFGFQFVLIFVLSTIPSGIITKSVYGQSLANTDWLHGWAEALLTVANVLIVLGFNQAMTNPDPPSYTKGRNIALAIAATFVAGVTIGPNLLNVHAPFLFGLGNLPQDMVLSLPWVSHTEPTNALSIPTWAIHFSSVIEYVFAMNLVWRFAETTQNAKWKGLTWGMLPLHASGLCACTYHLFYNPPELQFLVTTQAGLTLLGNITLMIAAFRIARSNGWTIDEINPFPKSSTSPAGLLADGVASMPLQVQESTETTQVLAAKLVGLTLLLSYAVKYGELGLDLFFTPNALAATAIIVGIPSITASYYYNLAQQEGGGAAAAANGEGMSLQLPAFLGGDKEDGEGPKLSMDDIKKYGVSGTVAYILTELAFWLVAFPVAATALYQSTGHWPDVINDNGDRAAVLAFIFAGANIARAFVPIRLGAALALAPWVDENILSRFNQEENDSDSLKDDDATVIDVQQREDVKQP